MIPEAEGSDKARDEQFKRAEFNAQWQEKFDALDREERRAQQKLEFEQTSKLNALEAQIYALQQKQAWAAQKKMQEESKAGKTPDMTAYAQALSAVSPEAKVLTAQRDELKNALQTAREKLSAQYSVKRTDLQNQRDDDLAKLSQ
jgi:BMFP domain-containing protein YqiC